jgi:DNA (cytosine-5)-methyltransferase 1
MIKVGSDFSGVCAFNKALMRLGLDYEEVFACESKRKEKLIIKYGKLKKRNSQKY